MSDLTNKIFNFYLAVFGGFFVKFLHGRFAWFVLTFKTKKNSFFTWWNIWTFPLFWCFNRNCEKMMIISPFFMILAGDKMEIFLIKNAQPFKNVSKKHWVPCCHPLLIFLSLKLSDWKVTLTPWWRDNTCVLM